MDSSELAPLYFIFASNLGMANLISDTEPQSVQVSEDEANLRLSFGSGIMESFVVNLFPGYIAPGQPSRPYDPTPFQIEISVSLIGK